MMASVAMSVVAMSVVTLAVLVVATVIIALRLGTGNRETDEESQRDQEDERLAHEGCF